MSSALGTRRNELEDLETIGFVASALFDVSAEKISRLRAAFEKNKVFYDDIADLYQSIKQTAFERGELPQKSVTVVQTVTVAFTSNIRFYGAVNAEVIGAFIEHMRSGAKSDYIVIGRTGKMLMENAPDCQKRTSYYAFKEDEPTGEERRQFLKSVAPYSQVQMFYPSFLNVFSQKVVMQDITYTPHAEAASGETLAFDYIFEPELPKILDFFETKVRYLLFKRVMLESELARTAARLLSMNQAQDRSQEEITRLRRAIRRDIENFNDLRLLESFSAISKWKK
jgi:ATP synthase F1 gamma subunit